MVENEEGVLQHHADLAAQAFLRHLPNIIAIHQDCPGGHVVEPRNQIDQGGLASAGGPTRATTWPGSAVKFTSRTTHSLSSFPLIASL